MRLSYPLLLASATVLASLLWSCGESRDESTPWNHTLGNTSEGAPLPRVAPDVAILQDATAYQPPKLAGTATGDTGGAPTAAAPDSADAQLRTLVTDLSRAIKDQEVELALRCYAPEHVEAFTEEHWDPLYTTLGLVDQIARRLARSKLEHLLGYLGGDEPAVKWDLLDADHASITPNPGIILFGPAKAGQAGMAVRGPGGWKLQLTAPLTADDVTAIGVFHKDVQAALERIIDWLDANPNPDEARLQPALTQALQGQMPDLEAPPAAPSNEDSQPGPTTPPEAEEPQRGGEPPEGP